MNIYEYIYIHIHIYIVSVSQELKLIFRDLMPEMLLSQKHRKHMGPILNVSVLMTFRLH